jgi:hypothetical protein
VSGREPFAPPSSPAPETETIGRVAHLLTHVAHQLPALAASQDTFEDIRRRYGKAMKELAARGEGRVTAPRAGVGVAYSYFSSARDLIKELQTLGWVEPGIPVPGSKATVDAHRTRRYPLTADGARVAAITSRRELADELSDALLDHHPYMRALLGALAQEPLFCPLAPQGEIQKHPSRRYWVEHLASTVGQGGREALRGRVRRPGAAGPRASLRRHHPGTVGWLGRRAQAARPVPPCARPPRRQSNLAGQRDQ